MDFYDVKIKRFADGTVQYRASLLLIPSGSYYLSPGSENKIMDPIRSAKVSLNRTVQKLYDIAHANVWEYFFTLTLDAKKVGDRYDYNNCADYIHRFTDLLYRDDCLYVIVPERHKDGAWHYHGLLTNCDNLDLVVNENGYLEFSKYRYGYCSCSHVGDSARAANYIMKYLIKGYDYLDIPKGKKRYWASRGLQLPVEDHEFMSKNEVLELINMSYYNKTIDNEFYQGYIIDCKE